MKKESSRSLILPLFAVPIGGLLTLGICYLLYLTLYMFVETQFFAEDPMSVPAGIIRNSFTAALILLYLLLLRTKFPDLLKAILLIGPVAMLLIAVTLALYEKLYLAVAGITAVSAFCLFMIYRYKKAWFYYYAVAISVAAAIFYAWPRS